MNCKMNCPEGIANSMTKKQIKSNYLYGTPWPKLKTTNLTNTITNSIIFMFLFSFAIEEHVAIY